MVRDADGEVNIRARCQERLHLRVMDDVLLSTMNDLPGYEVVTVHGEVFGLIVRARNVFSNIGAGLRTVFGGEAKGYTQLLSDSGCRRWTASATPPASTARTRCSRRASTATRSPTS